jgi:hypothetical protein
MASLLNTFNFVLAYIWATAKTELLCVFATCGIYLFSFDDFYWKVLSLNCLIVNFILINSIFNKDKYLKLDGFYKFFNIAIINILISKSILIFAFLSIHLSLLLFFPFNKSLIVCLLSNISLLSILILIILFIETKEILIPILLSVLLLSILFLINDLPLFLIVNILFLLGTGYLLLNIHNNNMAKIT